MYETFSIFVAVVLDRHCISSSKSVVLKLEHASKSLEGLTKTSTPGSQMKFLVQ